MPCPLSRCDEEAWLKPSPLTRISSRKGSHSSADRDRTHGASEAAIRATLASPSRCAQRPQQPRSGHAPVASNGVGRDVENVGGLFDCQPGKELELDHLHLARVERGKTFQRL